MESSTPSDEFDSAGEPTPAGVATTETHVAPLPVICEQCSACGATLASDQRYCVECGQRCGAARPPFTDGVAQRAQRASGSQPRSAQPRMSVNSTLIAGVGTLLLAMGIGVLIGRSGAGSGAKSVSPAVQVVTVPGAGSAAASTESQTSTGAATTTKSSGASAAKTAKTASKTPAVPPTKAVTVGSAGTGPGYEKGHFTGNFFGK